MRTAFESLGVSLAERIVRALLLLVIFLMPIGAVLILATDQATVAGSYNSFAVPRLYPQEFLIAGAALIWVFLRRPGWRLLFPYRWLFVPVGVAAASFFWATYPLLAVVSAVHLMAALLLLIMLSEEFRDPVFAKRAAWTFVAATAVQAVWATSQYLIGHDLGLQKLGESLLAADLPNVAKVSGDHTKHIRAYGGLPHPDLLAAYLVTAIFFVGTVIFWPHRTKKNAHWFLLPLLLVLLNLALVLTFARVAIAITIINGLLVILFSARRWHRLPKGVAVAAIVFFASLLLLWPQASSRAKLESSSETGVTNRLIGYELAGSMISDRPLGVGAGNFVVTIDQLKDDVPDYQHQPVHNALVLVAAELGAIPAVFVLAWIVRLGWLFHLLRPKDRHVNTLNFSLFCLAGAFIAMGATDHFFWSLPQGLWLGVLLAAAVVSRIPRELWLAHYRGPDSHTAKAHHTPEARP